MERNGVDVPCAKDLELSGPDSRVQQPEFGRYTPMQVPAPRSQVLGKTNMPMVRESGLWDERG